MEKAQHGHFALEWVADKFQESAPAKVHSQCRMGVGDGSEKAAQQVGPPFGRVGLGVEQFQSRLLQAFEQLGPRAQASGYQRSLSRE